ncbi:hypothetical protein Cgig2_024225 [Carnegiea gigantea]|uniref:Verticillium wilt resistance-like protein n=1 Tax=Carnegiea gigantea TaxID=171969 RepID=A0A9Q1GUK0_9CARY|nr:hypothetical protein Cgig2_024225 [Carnegiea gigantea]
MTKPVFLWLLWVPFILILTSMNTQLSWSKCLEDQQSLLLQLRSSLDVNLLKSRKLSTWNQTSDCCEWRGVQCNDSTGQVIGLDLCGESIKGGIDNSSSLFSLHFLQSLNLANNSFNNAQIPSEFGKLSGLIYLNLSNAGFSGQVPMEISQLTKLETLDLSSNSEYSGFSTTKLENPTLGMLIQNLSNIRELRLDGVIITANGSELWKALAFSVPRLQVLSLSNCNLSGNIDSSLEKLQSLSEIILAQNNFATAVPDFLANFSCLTVLKLSSCKLTGTVPQGILQAPTLRTLDLSYNGLLKGTLPEFPVNGSLQNLILSYTNLSGRLPNSIGNLKQLNKIELQNASFSGLIPLSMAGLEQLVHLDFSNNNFSGPIPSFSEAKNLTYLDLSKNMLSGTAQSTNWGSLTNLVSLDLSNNFLHGSIPSRLLTLPSLQKLQLNQNEFSGKLEAASFRPYWVLGTLDLSHNNLEGPVPKSLFGMTGLKILKLSSNNFSGSLKLNLIQQLKNLSTLDLSYNKLVIDANDSIGNFSSFPQLSTLKLAACELYFLPDFLRNQSRLEVLDLSANQIQGTLPKWIWAIGDGGLSYLNLSCNNFVDLELPLPDTPALSVLDIHLNNFRGEVPSLSSKTATYLDYSSNAFTSIHSDIGSFLSYALYFSLSRNNISGVIPMALCNATVLQVLDLSRNNLIGAIPDCVLKMTSTLGVLNLGENLLNGTIPDAFPEDCSLSTIDFGKNMLRGQLPRSLANCKKLEVLNLGRNQLRDTFPLWWMDLSNLRVLVLRDNELYGSIACVSSNTSWSTLQIIDLASNHFNGELKAQCFLKFTALMTRANNEQFPISELQFPKQVENLAIAILLPFGIIGYTSSDEESLAPEERIGHQLFEIDSYDEEDNDETEDKQDYGRFCVFCTKLDVERKRVIHNPRCTCHDLPSISSSPSTSSSK